MHRIMAACIAMIVFFLPTRGLASICSMEVSPLTLELQGDPGRAYTGAISVKNAGQDTQHVKAYCQDWTLKPDGLAVFVGPGKLPGSASEWVALSPTEFDLQPNESTQVRYTIRVPTTATGEARTVIILEASGQEMTLRGTPSRVVPRVGTIVYMQIGAAAQPKARITQFSVSPENGGLLVIENDGATHLRFTGRLEMRRSSGLVRSKDLTGFVVLPAPFNQHRVVIQKDVFAGLDPGEYEVTAVLDCGAPALLGARTNLVIGVPKGR